MPHLFNIQLYLSISSYPYFLCLERFEGLTRKSRIPREPFYSLQLCFGIYYVNYQRSCASAVPCKILLGEGGWNILPFSIQQEFAEKKGHFFPWVCKGN